MAERTTVTQGVQIGAEVTEGTGVAASKKPNGLEIAPMVKSSGQKFTPLGNKFPTLHALGKEWGEAPIKGVPCYSELHYLFSSLLATVVAGTIGSEFVALLVRPRKVDE